MARKRKRNIKGFLGIYALYVAGLHLIPGPWKNWKRGRWVDKWTLTHILWGAVKAFVHTKKRTIPCADCAAHKVLKPMKLANEIALAPYSEEVLYRSLLQDEAGFGVAPSAVLFGLAHYSPKSDRNFTVFRVADATLGGLLYGLAYNKGGLAASALVHGLHNLGTVLGGLSGIKAAADPNPSWCSRQAKYGGASPSAPRVVTKEETWVS